MVEHDIKIFRVHHGGTWAVGGRLCKYEGGQYVDSIEFDGNEVSLLDLNDWGKQVLPIPSNASISWSWLMGTNIKEISTDRDLMEMWEESKPDFQGYTHLFVEISKYDYNQLDADYELGSSSPSSESDGCSDDEQDEPETTRAADKDKGKEIMLKCFNADDSDEVESPSQHGETLEVGQVFTSVYECREYLRLHSLRKMFVVHFKKNDSDRIDARCKTKGCPWRCYVPMMNDRQTFKIRKLESTHTCEDNMGDTNSSVDSRFIASQIEEQMRLHHRSFTPKDIMNEMWAKFQLRVKYGQAWNARGKALEKLHGNYDESYMKVPGLCKQVLISNLGSVAKWSKDIDFNTFTSLCICWKPSIDGFIAGSRPFIGLDGCHMKGKHGGVVLSIVALDGNNGLFPLAIYIGRKENAENWSKFLEIMHPYLDRHPAPLTIISDRQKGLVQAIHNQRTCQGGPIGGNTRGRAGGSRGSGRNGGRPRTQMQVPVPPNVTQRGRGVSGATPRGRGTRGSTPRRGGRVSGREGTPCTQNQSQVTCESPLPYIPQNAQENQGFPPFQQNMSFQELLLGFGGPNSEGSNF